MADDLDILERAAAWSDAGLGVAVATVVSTWGSAPRPVGSHLAVNDRGELVGSVSGGCVEGAVVGEALATIADGRARTVEYGVTHARAWEVGLACGGTVRVRVDRLGGAAMTRDLIRQLTSDLAARRAVVLAIDVGSGEARLLHPLEPAGEGGDAALVAAAREAAASDASRTVEAGGRAVFLRVYDPPVRVVIVGAVHVAQALAPMVRLAGYDVVVVDPRTAFATGARFHGIPLAVEWPEEAMRALGLDRRTAVVAVTHDPKLDDPALAAALRSDAFYVGALGSRKTQAARRERLRDAGFSDADLARIHGPVGLRIGAVSTGEIAVSILSELVSVLRAGHASLVAGD